MAHPFHHALSSAKKWGGGPEDYLLLHQYMDQSKAAEADFRHRAILHHSFGIFMLEQHFGPVIQNLHRPHRSCPIHRRTTCDPRFGPDSNTCRLDPLHPPGTLDGPHAARSSRGRSLRAHACVRRIMTMFATYLRLHLPVDANWRAVVRAAASRLAPRARRDASKQQARRDFYRTMIEHHANAQSRVRLSRL